ncbi:hypothetical protein GB931_06950 [Modestobacter sp. I12A-02628]|uniref:Uncharacterized protein n=1 Tax=Goekera deserti TaxID=2497753 RepID=A0A7K3WD96_9ACTN|nr:hypothetical protein [Goekera deserti]MPQ97661.1 hypothetical protein [Goekera deserti]NDI47735.1 hypothetical protein [Goekera deserti]NEL53483.1 hypothetical protein [Goekera deserti]
MLIDCDTCTVRGDGCADCVVTVLLGAPPGWRGTDPLVVPLRRRAADGLDTLHSRDDAPESVNPNSDLAHIDTAADGARAVVDLDEVERRAVGALADFGLVPPLRHQDASGPGHTRHQIRDRHVS